MDNYIKGNQKKMSVVYGIRHKVDLTIHYIGSTKNQYHRFKSHKSYCNNPNARNYTQAIYSYIRENGGWDEYECFIMWVIPEYIPNLFVRMIEQYEINRNGTTVKNKSRAFIDELDDYTLIDLISNEE